MNQISIESSYENDICSDPIIIKAIKLLERNLTDKRSFCNTKIVYNFLRLKMENYPQEHFAVMYLDNNNHLIEYKELFIGGVNEVSIYVRDIIRYALLLNSVHLILAHNHPSGNSEPSKDDQVITKKVIEAGKMFDIEVLDHFVIGKGEYVSFAQRGWIK